VAAPRPEGAPAELLACEVDGDRLAVTARRALGGWPLDGLRPIVWAMGPVSEGSNATAPVPLYHLLKLPGAAAPRAVNAPTGADLTLNLGAPPAPGGACAPLAAGGGGGAPPPAPAAATIDAAPGNVFEFTIGWVAGWAGGGGGSWALAIPNFADPTSRLSPLLLDAHRARFLSRTHTRHARPQAQPQLPQPTRLGVSSAAPLVGQSKQKTS
jgi:hypothetical protein